MELPQTGRWPSNGVSGRRQSEGEDRAAPWVTLRLDFAAVRVNCVLGDRQAQPRATAFTGSVRFIKALEYTGEILRQDARASVDDLDTDRAVFGSRSHGNRATWWRELERILY